MQLINEAAAAQIIGDVAHCTACLAALPGQLGTPKPLTNAVVVDAASNMAHVGDLVDGTTACGLNANLWTWVVPAKRPDQVARESH